MLFAGLLSQRTTTVDIGKHPLRYRIVLQRYVTKEHTIMDNLWQCKSTALPCLLVDDVLLSMRFRCLMNEALIDWMRMICSFGPVRSGSAHKDGRSTSWLWAPLVFHCKHDGCRHDLHAVNIFCVLDNTLWCFVMMIDAHRVAALGSTLFNSSTHHALRATFCIPNLHETTWVPIYTTSQSYKMNSIVLYAGCCRLVCVPSPVWFTAVAAVII